MDGHDFKEKTSQVLGVGTFGVAPTPHESLPLDMYQTALDQDSWPQHPQDAHQMEIAVDGSAVRKQAMLFEMRTKGVKVAGSFSHLGSSVDNRAGLSFHRGKDSFALVEKRSVQKKVAMSCQFDLVGGRMFKPILDDASNAANTVTALSSDLSHRIALNDPALKPDTLAQPFIKSVLPNESVTASTTTKALPAFRASSMLSNLRTTTIPTMLFCSSNTTIVERLQQ